MMEVQAPIGGGTQAIQTYQPQTSRNVETRKQKYKGALFALGKAEVTIGLLSIVACIVSLITGGGRYSSRHSFTWVSQGIWCGIFPLVSGILGTKAKSKPSICMYNANLALSITAAVFMGILVIMSSLAAITSWTGFLLATHSLLAILGFVGLVICIIHSALCCGGVCCDVQSPHGVAPYVFQPPIVQQPQQMVQLANGQYMMINAQPAATQYPQSPRIGGQVTVYPPQENMIAPTQMTSYAASPGTALATLPPPAGHFERRQVPQRGGNCHNSQVNWEMENAYDNTP